MCSPGEILHTLAILMAIPGPCSNFPLARNFDTYKESQDGRRAFHPGFLCMLVLAFLGRVVFLVLVVLFGDGVGRHLDRDAVAVGEIVGWRRLLLLRRRRKVGGNSLHQALDAIPARRIAVRIEFLLALAIVDIEDIVLIGVAIVDSG